MIQIRQSPLIAILLLVVGLGVGGAWLVDANIIFLIIGGLNVVMAFLLAYSHVVEIDSQEIRVKNVLGMVRRRIPHPGLNFLKIVGGTIIIEKDGRQVIVNNVHKKWLHTGDWTVMENAIQKARNHAGN